MSSVVGDIFGKPKRPKIFTEEAPEPAREITVIQEEAEKARRREKKRLLTGGRRGTILSGIQTMLKKRLGE